MMFLALTSIVGLILAPQASPNPASNGTTPSSGAKASGAANSNSSPDLADVLSLIQSRSGGQQGGGGRFSPPNGDDVQVSSPDPSLQFAPTIVVDPTDRLHLIGAATDLRSATIHSAFYASFDGGATWSESFDLGSATPTVAFGGGGEVFACAARSSGGGSPKSDIYGGRSFDGGLTMTNWVKITNNGGYAFAGSATIAVDRSGGSRDGTAYIAFTEGGQGFDYVELATSSDGGATWSIAGVSDSSAPVVLSSLAVDGQGVVCVAFYDYTQKAIFFDSSSDGGVTFGADVKIAAAKEFDIPNFVNLVSPAPRIAVDQSGGPFDGTLYVVWDKGGSGGPDVVLSSSSDHGATWTTPIVVSDVTTESQFAPSITVDPQGNVVVGFYDARDDSSNHHVHFYVSRSSDGGATFQPNVALSDRPSTLVPADAGYVVQRTGIAASDQRVHSIWTDDRNGNEDIFTSTGALDFSTDAEFLPASTGGTVTFTVSPGPLFQNDLYQIVGSTSGTTPGLDLFFVHLPLNFDPFFAWTIVLANGSSLPGFVGTLDATGTATGALVSGPLPPALIGYQMDFAVVVEVGSAFRWASDATHLEIGN
jgi:hypothetical protein